MTEKTIQLTALIDGQPQAVEVGMAYCFATEIAYRDLAGEDIGDFMQSAAIALSGENPRMPDIRRTIYAILASVMAYSQAKGTQAPVRDADLMTYASPTEIGEALGTVIGLRQQFYTLPAGEPKDKEEKPTGRKGRKKNA